MIQTSLHGKSQLFAPPPTLVSSGLPILDKSTEVYKLWHSFLADFPKPSRYTLGEKIDRYLLTLIEALLKAAYASRSEKRTHVTEASITLDMVKLFLKITWELKLLDTKKYTRLSEALAEVGKMLGGWQKQIQPNASESKSA